MQVFSKCFMVYYITQLIACVCVCVCGMGRGVEVLCPWPFKEWMTVHKCSGCPTVVCSAQSMNGLFFLGMASFIPNGLMLGVPLTSEEARHSTGHSYESCGH